MLELAVSPSPSPGPITPAADTATPASATPATGATSSPDRDTSSPFAAILQRHQAQPADENAAKVIKARLAAQEIVAKDPAATAGDPAQTDMIAFLAPMLAGIVSPTVAAPSTTADEADSAKDKLDPTTATVIAAPITPDVMNNSATVKATDANVRSTTGQSDSPLLDVSRPTAFLAAGTTVAAGIASDTGNTGTTGKGDKGAGFESLLAASREAPMSAAHHAAAANAAASAAAAAPAATQISTPVGARGWDSEIGQKIVWMTNRQETRADLVLNPPELGRIEVSLSVKGDQASATFVSASPAVREALENAVPRLREILQDAGISLGQTQVGAESFQQAADKRENNDNSSRGSNLDSGTISSSSVTVGATAPQWTRHVNGLVDTFA